MERQDEITHQDKFNQYLDLYLSDKRNNQDEFEIRFGTKYYNQITKIDFENIPYEHFYGSGNAANIVISSILDYS